MSRSRVSRETPSQDVRSFDQRVTQCKSTVAASLSKLRKDFQSHRRKTFLPSSITNSHLSREISGVGPADKTGKSVVRYCPGGSFTSVGERRPAKPLEMILMRIFPCLRRLRSRLRQSALLDNKGCDLLDTFATLQIRENKRPIRAHSNRIRFHDRKVSANKRSQVDFVDNQKVGTRYTWTAFAWYFFALRNIDDIDSQISKFRAERCGQIVTARFDETQFRVGKFPVHFVDRGEVHGCIFANGGVRATSGLDAHDALRWKSFGARQDELVFLRIDVIRDYVDVVLMAKPLAEGFDKSGLARSNRATDSDAERMILRECSRD